MFVFVSFKPVSVEMSVNSSYCFVNNPEWISYPLKTFYQRWKVLFHCNL
jgi:hypothetical protein